jgi:hypothetical protein
VQARVGVTKYVQQGHDKNSGRWMGAAVPKRKHQETAVDEAQRCLGLRAVCVPCAADSFIAASRVYGQNLPHFVNN